MELRSSLSVWENAVKNIYYLSGFYSEARLFQNFALYTQPQSFAQLQHAARKRPLAPQRLGSAAHQHDFSPAYDCRAYAYDRTVGVIS